MRMDPKMVLFVKNSFLEELEQNLCNFFPFKIARENCTYIGVRPFESLLVLEAPFSTRILATATDPTVTASCNGEKLSSPPLNKETNYFK